VLPKPRFVELRPAKTELNGNALSNCSLKNYLHNMKKMSRQPNKNCERVPGVSPGEDRMSTYCSSLLYRVNTLSTVAEHEGTSVRVRGSTIALKFGSSGCFNDASRLIRLTFWRY
jgi:hypothetical protein